MQIRLTVALAPRGARSAGGSGGTAGAGGSGTPQTHPVGSANVLVTAPAGTVLSAVTGALATSTAAALAGSAAPGDTDTSGSTSASRPPGTPRATGHEPAPVGGKSGGEDGPQEPVVVYAGTRRLDPHRQIIGEPPLLDGALVSLHAPVAPATLPAHGAALTALRAYGSAKARLHVVAGPDAGGIHLLQGGKVLLGRSAEADVPLDDPDVSRLHCAVTVTDGGAVTVTDLGSTNGTTLDGAPVGTQPALFPPGATLRLGETSLRLEAAGSGAPAEQSSAASLPPLALPTVPDGEGRLRLARQDDSASAEGPGPRADPRPATGPYTSATGPYGDATGPYGDARGQRGGGGFGHEAAERGPEGHAYTPGGPFPGGGAGAGTRAGTEETHGFGVAPPPGLGARDASARKGKGLGAWARRFAGGRAEPAQGPDPSEAGVAGGPSLVSEPPPTPDPREGLPSGPTRYGSGTADGLAAHPQEPGAWGAAGPRLTPHEWEARWPDPAAVLLNALGPGPRLWERAPGHPDALTVRLGVSHRGGGHGDPVTVDLRQARSLGLAGPRARLAGLARAVLAQLAALHGPSALEIVVLSADRTRDAETRRQEWSWLGWLPHLRPAHGQDCGLLTAYDREQAAARTAELIRRLDAAGIAPAVPVSPEAVSPEAAAGDAAPQGGGGLPGGPREGHAASPRDARVGPAVVVVVDGDPGSAALRASVERLAREGAAAGIHLICLAETPAASPSSPVTATVEAANAVCPVFPECGTVALLSGDVATAVRVLHRAPGHTGPTGRPEHQGRPAAPGHPAAPGGAAPGHTFTAADGAGGPVATVDAVSLAWAERFARALAPLREPDDAAARAGLTRPTVTLPEQCRLLDELGLARATPAALLARWSERLSTPAGRAPLVFGAGPHGPLEADLAHLGDRAGPAGEPAAGMPTTAAAQAAEAGVEAAPAGGHALISGGAGAGKTELLRSLSASLAAGERPDRLALVLVDGAGAGSGEGLRACTDLPHVTEHLVAGDPVRMRQFAQALSAEVKRRAELIGDDSSYDAYVRLAARPGGRVVAPRQAPERAATPAAGGSSRAGTASAPVSASSGESSSAGAEVQVPAPAQAPDERTAVAAGQPARQAQGLGGLGPRGSGGGQDGGPAEGAGGFGGSGGAPGTYAASRPSAERSGTWRETLPSQATQSQDPADGAGDASPGGAPRAGAPAPAGGHPGAPPGSQAPGSQVTGGQAAGGQDERAGGESAGALESDRTQRTLRLRQVSGERGGGERAGTAEAASALAAPSPLGPNGVPPRLVVLVDDFDTLVDPALGNPGRPAAGSVVRALEAVVRSGARLGVHVVAATGRPDRTAATLLAQQAALHARLTGGESGPAAAPPGRGTLVVRRPRGGRGAGDTETVEAAAPVAFQAGRVTGRIPRTATVRPTVVPLDWARAGDPPARRQVRELGNGPTDLALLASAMERAAQQAARAR
ncbi:FtsK/SpoIIIE domain-containing protein [Streptomyces diacarni]|uniref:FtsK/SpoIIIE domain-containing protein n=1 Tax=Streptomyces diacarni TaxID=2800381 RepID=UPI001C68F5C6|nr:FtsK/SpoIIIE domain-containing protein [Streptomyces diacarni]